MDLLKTTEARADTMEKVKIDRINELGRIAKVRELTESEKCEREELRKEYLEEFRRALRNTAGEKK